MSSCCEGLRLGGDTVSEKAKQPWSRPELIVLVRGKPEERVLSACKTVIVSGPGTSDAACDTTSGSCDTLESS